MAEATELTDEVHRAPAPRIVSASARDSLERFSDPELLANGKVNVISLEAVQARLGVRWDVRTEQVYDFTDRVLERGLGVRGAFLRISDTDYCIVQPDLGPMAGQIACMRYLREVLNHFLGEATLANAGVLQVSRIDGATVEAARVDPSAHSAAALEAEAAAEASKAGRAASNADRWTPFVTADGREIRVSATLEPVYEVKAFSRIGFRMMRRVLAKRREGEEELPPHQVAQLSTADLLRVDLATIGRGIGRLRAETEQQLSLIVPVSYTSLSSQKGRTELVKQLKEAGALVRLGVICEIVDVEGVPPSILLSAASLVRPFTLLVVGRLNDTSPKAIQRLDGAGLQALSFDCPQGLTEPEFLAWAAQTMTAAKRIARSVLVYGGGTPARAATLASLGATHVSVGAGAG